MAYPDLANVNVSLLTTTVSVANIDTPIFLTEHTAYVERVREFTDSETVGLVHGLTSEAYKAATSYYSQLPKPTSLKIGRIDSSVQYTLAPAAEGDTTSLEIGVNTNAVNVVSYETGAAEDEEDIVDALISALDGLYPTELTSTKVGTGAAAKLNIEATSGNSFAIGDVVGLTGALTALETAAVSLVACTEEDPNFFFVTDEYNTETSVLAMSTAVAAQSRMYFTGQYEAESIGSLAVPAISGDICGKLAQLGYDNSVGIFHQTATTTYPELAYIGRFCSFEPETIDWFAKALAGVNVASTSPVTGNRINATEEQNLVDRNTNAIDVEGGVNVVKMGKTFSGQNIGVIWFTHFYAARLKEAFQSLRINKNKIPFDQAGIDMYENVFNKVSDRYLSLPDRPHAISSYKGYFPRREDVSFTDVASGYLAATATVYLAGSILRIDLGPVLTFEAEF